MLEQLSPDLDSSSFFQNMPNNERFSGNPDLTNFDVSALSSPILGGDLLTFEIESIPIGGKDTADVGANMFATGEGQGTCPVNECLGDDDSH